MSALKIVVIVAGILLSIIIGGGVLAVVVIPKIMNGAPVLPSLVPLIFIFGIIWVICALILYVVKKIKK